MTDIATPAGAPALGAALDRGPELRSYRLSDIEFREPDQTGDGQFTFIGHAAVFELLSLPLYDWWFGEFREKIAPGAFTNVLARDPDVHLVYVHDMASAMARTRSKTLELSQDPRGLRAYARLDPTDPDVQRVAPKMRRGDVDQMSFAFTVARDEWLIENEGTPDEVVTRTIHEVGELYDVSIVPQGAFPQTDGSLRNREARRLIRSAVRRGALRPRRSAPTSRRSPAWSTPTS
jgi:HK97 family phage prohead protease